MSEFKTYSVLLNWNDDDKEQGTFGATVKALSYEDAEVKARARMRDAFFEECGIEMTGNGGAVLDCTEGAAWCAMDLETALRDLVRECRARMLGFAEITKAETVLDEIEKAVTA